MKKFSVIPSYEELEAKNYSLNPGQYFEIKIQYTDITQNEFKLKIRDFREEISSYNKLSDQLLKGINTSLDSLNISENEVMEAVKKFDETLSNLDI